MAEGEDIIADRLREDRIAAPRQRHRKTLDTRLWLGVAVATPCALEQPGREFAQHVPVAFYCVNREETTTMKGKRQDVIKLTPASTHITRSLFLGLTLAYVIAMPRTAAAHVSPPTCTANNLNFPIPRKPVSGPNSFVSAFTVSVTNLDIDP